MTAADELRRASEALDAIAVALTPAMRAVLTSEDGRGRVYGSPRTTRAMERLGLVEPIGFGLRLTDVGRALVPSAGSNVQHRTRTYYTNHATRLNGRMCRYVADQTAVVVCSCGWSAGGATRDEAREAARRHRAGALGYPGEQYRGGST